MSGAKIIEGMPGARMSARVTTVLVGPMLLDTLKKIEEATYARDGGSGRISQKLATIRNLAHDAIAIAEGKP